MTAPVVKWLLNELNDTLTLIDSAATAEKSRVAAIRTEAAKRFEKCYQHFTYIQKNRNLKFAPNYSDHPELVVLVAEIAFKTGFESLSREVIEDYFDERPDKGAFYCRARQLMGLILNFEASKSNGSESIELRKKALSEVMESLSVAQNTKNMEVRYAFIVYNTSVTCWQIVRPFLREGRGKYFVDEVSKVSAALEKVDDVDMNWRIRYLSAAAVCFTDDGKGKEASDALDKAIVHAEKLLGITVDKGKVIAEELAECTKVSEEFMNAMREVEDREEQLAKPPKIDPDLPEGEQEVPKAELPPLEGLAAKGYQELKQSLDDAQKSKAAAEGKMKDVVEARTKEEDTLCKLYMQRVHSLPGDAKKVQGLPLVAASPRMRTLINLQCMMSGCIPDKDWQATFDAIFKDLTAQPQSNSVIETLLDVSRVADRLRLVDLARQFEAEADKSNAVSPEIRVKSDLVKAVKIVTEISSESANQKTGQRLSSKAKEGYGISRRVEALKLLERTLAMCLARLHDNPLVEEICVAIWNTGLPLCTPHLREHVHTAFGMAADALERTLSTLVVLRAQLHLELSKCEERADFVVKAKEEGVKALLTDYGGVEEGKKSPHLDRNRHLDHLINPYVEVLQLRSDLYGSPQDPESQASLMLQSIKESNSKLFQRDTLDKAAALLFGALDREEEEAGDGEGGGGDEEEKGGEEAPPKRPTRLGQDGEVTQMPVADVEAMLSVDRGANFAAFNEDVQRRVFILASVAQIAHSQRNVQVTQWAAQRVLREVWDPSDPFVRPLLDRQVDMHFLLADCLVERLAGLWIEPEQEDAFAAREEAAAEGEVVPNPRTLGVQSEFASEDIATAKRLVCLALQKAVEVCLSTEDQYGLQNAVIYFWNLHLPLFRNRLYGFVTDEVEAFLKTSLETMQRIEEKAKTPSVSSPGALDGKLKANIVEAVGLVSEAKGNVPAALEVVNKGAADTAISVYARRKLSELAGRLAVTQAPGKSSEPPKLDHPVLAVYHLLAQSEAPEEKMPPTEAAAAVDKAVGVMQGDLQAWIDGQDWAEMSLDDYNEVMEMRAECWCRLTRGKIASGDIYGSQDTAEQCMQLVSEEVMQKADEKRLSPRVWRWLAICERYFGMAIQGIISPDGMDKALQDELSLAALRHFNISCGYSQRAGKEELLVEAAVSAWNASMHLIDSPGVRHSLQLLQRQVLESLLTVREENMEAAALKQQFYVALIECISFDGDWDAALEVVLEAFENVPAKLQKPLWKWRVVALSKKGKNVLDGIQKLKEGDPSLQARVYGILARASADPKQQLEAYRKTIEILGEDIERVDYELETAQWMASAGVPRIEIVEVVQGALDCLYEVEDKHLIDAKAEGSQALNDAASAHSSHSSHSSSTARSKATGRGNKSASNSRRNSRAGSTQGRGVSRAGGSKHSSRGSSSRAGSAAEEEEDEGGMPADLHAKQLEQAVRSLSMLAMLSSVDLTREERANEAVYFVRRFFGTWAGALKESAKESAYWKLTPAERDETPLEAFQGPAEAVSGLDFPIDDAVAMLRWAPSETFQAAQQAALEFQPADVPTPKSMPSLPLTLHYCLWLAGCLEQYGYSKHALLVLAFARCLFMMVDVDNALSALAVLQFKAMGVLARCGLHELIPTLPASLGASEVSCEAFVAGFGSKLIDPVGVKAKEHIASEHMSVFGFSSWTQALDGVDPSACALELCRELLSLGQTSQCLAVAEGVRRDFIVKRDARGLACISSVLAELHMIGGRVGDVLATVLAQMENLESVGDATELWNHVRLAVQAYRRSARGAEAKRVCLDAVATLAEFCSIAIAKEPPRAGTAGTGMPVSASSSVASGQPSVTSNNRRTSVQTHVESSIETTAALRDAVHTYVDLLVAEAQETAGRSQTLGETYLQVRERLSRLEELATSVCGSNSVLVASVCEKRGVACAALLDAMHGASSVPGKGADEYPAWLEEQYAEANGYLRRCTDIRRGLLSRITFEEQSFLPLVAPPAQQAEEEVPDPKAKKGKGAEPEPEPEPKQAAMALLSVPMARDTAFAELHLARQSLVLARLRGDQLTALPPPPTEDPTVIEQYLESTQPPVPFKGEDFRAPDIMLAASTASSAAQLLSGTEHAREGELLCAVSGVMRWCGSGAFDKAWVAPPERKKPAAEDVPAEGEQAAAESESEPGANEGVAPAAPEFDERAVLARAALVDVCAASLGGQLDGEVAMAAVALVDAFGNLHGGAREAAPWLLLSQSLRAKEWLMSTWRAALNPACEVSAAVQRLDSLEASRLPSKEALPQILAEQTFLRAASPSWRRLEVTEDPAAVLQRMPARTALLSLQICPSNKAIYACAGLPEPVEGEATPYVAGGKWVVDKMPLGEPERRLLLTLVQQQRKWKEDAAKFVAVYGENVSPDQDLAGVESAQAGKLGKVERALEERLRAVLADMELALQPLLGPDSVLGAFLRSLLAPELAEDGTVAPTQPEPLSLLLLVDPSLQELPWEGHSSVAGFCGRVGRDFSLHLLGHRLSSHTDVVVRSSSLSTVFDPFGDDTGSKIEGYERPSIGEVTRALSETVLGAGSWASLKGTPGLLTLQDWITCTQLPAPVPDAKGNVAPASKVSVFLFAPGRMGSLLSPSELASMDMGSVLMLQAVDQGLSDAAFRRQNTLDNTKRPSDIAKEDALNMAALASLAGAGCVNTHLWATTLAAQRRFVNGFWDSFGQGGSSLAAMSAASLLIPPQSEGEEAAAAPAPKSLKPWVYLARIAYGLPTTYAA